MTCDNNKAVRRYYQAHRNAIIRHKTLAACAKTGRIPRPCTCHTHKISKEDLQESFEQFKRLGDEEVVEKRAQKLEALINSFFA